MKGAVAAAVVVASLPCAGRAQSRLTAAPTLGGFDVGAESSTTWFLNTSGYSMNTGWTTGESRPLTPSRDGVREVQNRRVQIVIVAPSPSLTAAPGEMPS